MLTTENNGEIGWWNKKIRKNLWENMVANWKIGGKIVKFQKNNGKIGGKNGILEKYEIVSPFKRIFRSHFSIL